MLQTLCCRETSTCDYDQDRCDDDNDDNDHDDNDFDDGGGVIDGQNIDIIAQDADKEEATNMYVDSESEFSDLDYDIFHDENISDLDSEKASVILQQILKYRDTPL